MRACSALIAALTLTGPARADIGVLSVSRTRAHPGTLVRVRVAGYNRPRPRLPLYLVAARSAPKHYACGRNAICEPRARRPPSSAPYTRIGRVHFGRSGVGTVQFRVPSLPPGRYRFVLYCAPCYRGPGGSLIVDDLLLLIR